VYSHFFRKKKKRNFLICHSSSPLFSKYSHFRRCFSLESSQAMQN